MWQVSTRSRRGRGAVSTQKFGAVFKNLGHSNILGQTLPPNNIQNVALPVLRLPQTREAAPNGAACCPFGAGFGLPQLSRQRSCHTLHTGISALYVLRCDLVCNIAPRKIALTTAPKFQRNSSAKTWSGKDGFFPVGYLLVVFFGAIFPSMVQIFALLVHFGANFLQDQCTLPRLVAYFTVWWFRAAAPWLNCPHLIYFDWWLMIWLLMIRLLW